MKIGVIVPGGVARRGAHGTIPCLLWLFERLARIHDVHVFALYQEALPSRYPLAGTQVYNIGPGGTRRRAMRTIIAEHRRLPFDLFHAFWATPPGTIAASTGWLLRRPVVLHLAGGELVALRDIGYGGRLTLRSRASVRLALAGAARITAGSHFIQEEAARLGYQSEHVPLGVARDRWPIREPQRRPTGREARLLHVGSLNRVKDQRTLLQSMKLLRDGGIDFRLDMVGEDTLAGELQRYAAALSIDGCVTFHGFLAHPQLRPLVEQADILLISSRHEAGPAVASEAAVAGVPTVGTSVGQIRDWAPDAAVAVPVGDHEALALATRDLLMNEERRLRIAATAQRRAVAEDADWTACRIDRVYRQIVGSLGHAGGGENVREGAG